MQGICKLCLENSELRQSHFVPKFIGKWLKRTSITGCIRNSQTFNKRSQDLIKEYWLCGKCEGLFSKCEMAFANKLFYPFVDQNQLVFPYDEWLGKFCASLSWRTLTYMLSLTNGAQESPDLESLTQAQTVLRDFLLGRSNHLLEFEQHLFPLEAIEITEMNSLPDSINRYLLRAIQMNIIGNESSIVIYTKLPSFLLLGLVKYHDSKSLSVSRVALKSGVIKPDRYTIPMGVIDYMVEQADKISKRFSELPPAQIQKIIDFMSENPNKVLESKAFQAVIADLKLSKFNGFNK